MILGRIAAGIMVGVFVGIIGIKFAPPITYLIGSITTGIPGIIIQLVFIPILLSAVKKVSPDLITEKN